MPPPVTLIVTRALDPSSLTDENLDIEVRDPMALVAAEVRISVVNAGGEGQIIGQVEILSVPTSGPQMILVPPGTVTSYEVGAEVAWGNYFEKVWLPLPLGTLRSRVHHMTTIGTSITARIEFRAMVLRWT